MVRIDLAPGESVVGVVEKLPERYAKNGTKLYLRVDGREADIVASASRGHAVLEHELARQRVAAGDAVRIVYHGRRRTKDGLREYRHYTVRVLERASARAVA